jgi:D-glycero-alpha-D-manno-heptose-7-phosphate kinase
MIIRSKAPLRIGLAGGGTDVSPYSDLYGGAILNATISLYAHATIVPTNDGMIRFNAADKGIQLAFASSEVLELDGELDLLKGIYNHIVRKHTKKPLSFELTTFVDVPPGSGLGTSSTLVIAILGAFAEWLNIPLGEYDMAHLAYHIERIELKMAGGKQDQYAATFGGVNFMEFLADDKVIVNPLRIKQDYLSELEHNLLLYYTDTSRYSSAIIEEQSRNVVNKNQQSIDAMHNLKEQAVQMKEALLRGNIDTIGEILDFGFRNKKKMAEGISNDRMDEIYSIARTAGASGGKISGAGGGGFMIFYCPGVTRYAVMDALQQIGGSLKKYTFTKFGLTTWTV